VLKGRRRRRPDPLGRARALPTQLVEERCSGRSLRTSRKGAEDPRLAPCRLAVVLVLPPVAAARRVTGSDDRPRQRAADRPPRLSRSPPPYAPTSASRRAPESAARGLGRLLRQRVAARPARRARLPSSIHPDVARRAPIAALMTPLVALVRENGMPVAERGRDARPAGTRRCARNRSFSPKPARLQAGSRAGGGDRGDGRAWSPCLRRAPARWSRSESRTLRLAALRGLARARSAPPSIASRKSSRRRKSPSA